MNFVTESYAVFLAIVLIVHWGLRARGPQNLALLVASYLFYGWIHPWFCLLIASSTICDYLVGLGMARWPARRNALLCVSLTANLGLLAAFKYFNFFADAVHAALEALGLGTSPVVLDVVLPVGISFYTFQTLSYTIDIWRGSLAPRRNLLDFALFVAFFPQLVAGPIERAKRFLPQIESRRTFDLAHVASGVPLIVRGLVKKLVVADNVAPTVDQIFLLESPGLAFLALGAVAFAIQIYGDFSGYTDIARGTARLLGFELIENFAAPYRAISPSDFWRRWHISLSTWIRDYLYIPLGGSRVTTLRKLLLVTLTTMGLAGLWHGAAWNFVVWGLFHGTVLWLYRVAGFAGRWTPARPWSWCLAWCLMTTITLAGWLVFRAPSLAWLGNALWVSPVHGEQEALAALALCGTVALWALPLIVMAPLVRLARRGVPASALVHGSLLALVVVMRAEAGTDFIYFQF